MTETATMKKPAKATLMARAEVLRRVRGLDIDSQRSVVCGLIGHSRIRDFCFGYHHCARCSALLGDSLAGAYSDDTAVYPSHLGRSGFEGCRCNENLKTLTWRDRLFVPEHIMQTLTPARSAGR